MDARKTWINFRRVGGGEDGGLLLSALVLCFPVSQLFVLTKMEKNFPLCSRQKFATIRHFLFRFNENAVCKLLAKKSFPFPTFLWLSKLFFCLSVSSSIETL